MRNLKVGSVFRSSTDEQPWLGFGDVTFFAFLAVAAASAVGLYRSERLDAAEISVLTVIGLAGVLGKGRSNAGRAARGPSPQTDRPASLIGSLFRRFDK